MFWGCIVKPGKPHQLQQELTDVLYISNISLHPKAHGKSSLYIKVGDSENLLVTSLESGKHEHATVNLYVRISDKVIFTVEGSGEIHVSGYFDPTDSEIEDLDDEEDLEADFPALKAQQKKLQKQIDEDELDDEDLTPAVPAKKVKAEDKKPVAPAKPVEQAKPQQQKKEEAKPQPKKEEAKPQPKKEEPKAAPKKDDKKKLDELTEEDLDNMTESELARLEAELEGGEELDSEGDLEGDEEMDLEDLEGLEEDDDDEDGEEEDEESEQPAKKPAQIPNVP